MLLIALPASADVWTGCAQPVRDAVGPQPLVGDGPWVGDAPDRLAVPVVLGCYTGILDREGDRDSYAPLPGWHNAMGVRAAFWAWVGCFDASVVVYDAASGFELGRSVKRMCEPALCGERADCDRSRWDFATLGVNRLEYRFDAIPGEPTGAVYQFAFE